MTDDGLEKRADCVAVFGTGSDVGKSIVTTALCRIFADRSLRVSPFKAQNMSNNSGVTPEGLEMGRAQVVQAEAARTAPHVDMNPILLKPTSDLGAQIVLFGEVLADSTADEYHRRKNRLFSEACGALDRLRAGSDMVVMEGAGSCAEVNLMPNDIVNFRMAEYAAAPVILVADIHRGGVFAQIVGTLDCLSPHQRDLIIGFVINRFRGDIRLFEDGVAWIEKKTGKPVFGVLPWYTHFSIESEDSVIIENPKPVAPENIKSPAIAVIRIPHISNFTDFEALKALKPLNVYFLERVQDLSGFAAVVLPGSKSTRFDLAWLRQNGWHDSLGRYVQAGGHVLGICGGYQMMGRRVHDPQGLEGQPGSSEGLGLLPVETVLKAPKTTTRTRFSWDRDQGTGYEIHMGRTDRQGGSSWFEVSEQNGVSCRQQDGCLMPDAKTAGTYMHGLFDNPDITRRWLGLIGLGQIEVPNAYGHAAKEKEYDLLAEHFLRHVDMKKLNQLLGA
ncbi:MAG: cobyric acid synthase [Desulfobacterales bacterium]